jgi:chlorobactene glucosyltransferase
VKALGLPIRVALARGIVSCRMYASFGQVVRGWSRILYDALGRNPWRLTLKLLDPVFFCQSGHLALVASLVLLGLGKNTNFAVLLFFLGLTHHFLMYLVFLRIFHAAVPRARWAIWYPIANVVVDLVLIRSLRMCLTGKVTWRGTDYGIPAAPARTAPSPVSKTR